MKCDELEKFDAASNADLSAGYDHRYAYEADEVDAAIAELKVRIADLEKLNQDLCERVTENDDIRLHWEEIEQTRAENERLKAKLEDVQASMYADVVDANMENRRLKRALWLARAERAKTEHLSKIMYSTLYRDFIAKWVNVERKCRAKAEEYK